MGNSSLVVAELDAAHEKKWLAYVNDSPSATFYHCIEWKDVIENTFSHRTNYLMALENDEVRGILPLVHLKSLAFGSILCSMPFLNYGGICADTEAAEIALLEEAKKILKRKRGDYVELRQTRKLFSETPFKLAKVSLSVELRPEPDEVWDGFDRKHRSAIRRIAKNGFSIEFGRAELLPAFYSIMSSSWKELGTPFYSYSFYEEIFRKLGNSVEIALVSLNGSPVASAMTGFFKDMVEGLWLGYFRDYAKLQPGYFLYWEMIRRYCILGYKVFNLGRSTTDSGGEFFKKKWNATTRQLYWEYILNGKKKIPELNVQNPKYKVAMKVWSRLPAAFTNILGPHIAKNIP